MFNRWSTVATADVLIRDDTMVEGTKCFPAELHSELPQYTPLIQNASTTICIEDSHTVLYTFQQQEFCVYESIGYVSVRLNSSEPIPSDVTVDVDVIDGLWNASGE